MRVLVVDDEESLASTIAYNLRRAGYEVETAADGEVALELLRDRDADLLVLDVMLPGMDGFEICRQVRRGSAVPILMLTARADEIDRVVGLEIGADDYLTKPFSMRELVARVKALLRRRDLIREDIAAARDSARALEAGDLRVWPDERRVELRGNTVALKPREFDLLVFLMRHRGHVFSVDRLLGRVWGYPDGLDSRTVTVHIRSLRLKVEDDPSNPSRILTVRGAGYRFAR